VFHATFHLRQHDWSLPVDIEIIGTLGWPSFLPMRGLSYSLSPEADPEYGYQLFWFLFAEPPRVVSVGEPGYEKELDVDNNGVLNVTDFFLVADDPSRIDWQSLSADSTQARVSVLVRTVNADFDSSGQVDWPDMFLFADRYGSKVGHDLYKPEFDLDGDGLIDLSDFFLFADRFGGKQ